MHLHLAGHLAWYDSHRRARVEIVVPRSVLLIDLLRDLGVPVAEIAVAAVNGNAVDLQTARVADSDRVELFPPVGGGVV
jgi:sulfur carrier protein ThiS